MFIGALPQTTAGEKKQGLNGQVLNERENRPVPFNLKHQDGHERRVCLNLESLTWSDGWQAGTRHTQVAIRPIGREGDEAWLVAGNMAVDPGVILRHSGVDAWEIRQSTAFSKAHNAPLDPAAPLLHHQRASRVPLRGETHLEDGVFLTVSLSVGKGSPGMNPSLRSERRRRSCCP